MIDTGCESPGTTLMHILIVKFTSEAFTSLQSGSSHSWLITLPWRRAPWCLCCLWCHKIYCGSDKVEVSVQCCQCCGVNNDIKSRLNSWYDVVHDSHGSLCPFPESSKSPEDIFLPSLAYVTTNRWRALCEKDSLFPKEHYLMYGCGVIAATGSSLAINDLLTGFSSSWMNE